LETGGARRTFGGSLILFAYSGLSGTGETCPRISRSRGSYPASYYQCRLLRFCARSSLSARTKRRLLHHQRTFKIRKKKNSTRRNDGLLFVNGKDGFFLHKYAKPNGRWFVNNRGSLAAKSISPNVAGRSLSRSWITRAECFTTLSWNIFAVRWRFDNPLPRNSEDEMHSRRRSKRAASGGIKGREGGGRRGRKILIVSRVYVYTGDVRSVGPACGPYCVPKGHIQ